MAKFILALCLLIGLTGCSSAENIENRIEETVIKEENTVYKARINTVGDYFSYYLPADCYRRESDNLSSVIDFMAGHIVLNLNIKDAVRVDGNAFLCSDEICQLLLFEGLGKIIS